MCKQSAKCIQLCKGVQNVQTECKMQQHRRMQLRGGSRSINCTVEEMQSDLWEGVQAQIGSAEYQEYSSS